MNNIKKIIIIFFYTLVLLEIISYISYKLNLLQISHKPNIYMSKDFIPIHNWWTEENKWGPWHKINSKTIQKKSCYDVIYESNEFGARDKKFNLSSPNNIILIGDSFAEGYGVNYNNTSQKYIEELTNYNVLNFGVSKNFGPVQYHIIYDELAKNFKHNKVLIYFLPNNDFGDNDYSNWQGSKRYRPYYNKIDANKYNTFIPSDSIKNYSSLTKKIKRKFSNYFWSSNLFINLNYQYKVYRSSKKIKNNEFSAYFNTNNEQQKAAIHFIDKIINTSKVEVILVSIPRLNDFKIYENNKIINNTYWNNYYVNKALINKNFKFIDLLKFKPTNINEIYLSCDGHWSPEGNLWAAKVISKFLD